MGGGLSHGWPCSLSLHPCWSHILVPGPPPATSSSSRRVFLAGPSSRWVRKGGEGDTTHTHRWREGPAVPWVLPLSPAVSCGSILHPILSSAPPSSTPASAPSPYSVPPSPGSAPQLSPQHSPPPELAMPPQQCPEAPAVPHGVVPKSWQCPQAPAVPRGIVPKPRQCP